MLYKTKVCFCFLTTAKAIGNSYNLVIFQFSSFNLLFANINAFNLGFLKQFDVAFMPVSAVKYEKLTFRSLEQLFKFSRLRVAMKFLNFTRLTGAREDSGKVVLSFHPNSGQGRGGYPLQVVAEVTLIFSKFVAFSSILHFNSINRYDLAFKLIRSRKFDVLRCTRSLTSRIRICACLTIESSKR